MRKLYDLFGLAISLVVNSPIFFALILKMELLKDTRALLWKKDKARFKDIGFFELLQKRPYYRQVIFYRLGWLGRFLHIFYPNYTRFGFPVGKNVHIGGGIYLDHPYCTTLNAKSIGDNFQTKQLVTVGNNRGGIPIIGNNVFIGTGAVVCGSITIGDNVRIGANCVVLKDVPPNCLVVGAPAYIIEKDGVKVNIKL